MANFRRAIELNPDYLNAHSNLLLTYNYLAHLPVDVALQQAKIYGEIAQRRAHPYSAWPNLIDASRCLRIGLVSGDLRQHPVGFFIAGVLEALAKLFPGRVALIAYATRRADDALTSSLKANCHAWISVVGMTDEKFAQHVRDDAIDILIDLSGHTAHNRLPMFAWKPAPIQVSWLGYFATTGLTALDYVLADPWTAPPGVEAQFVEKIWRLPETRLCFTPPDTTLSTSALPALHNGYVTFGCFGNLTKMNDAVVGLWSGVLRAVPGSRLFLKAKQFDEPSMRLRVLTQFARQGIGPERMMFDGYSDRSDYLASYAKIDIVLDTFPFPGGTTTAEALWMGVPVLAVTGESFVSRQGSSLLMNAGLAHWIARDEDNFVELAVKHSADLRGLAALRAMLRHQLLATPLFDAPRFAANLEAALRGMWTNWCVHRSAADS